MSGDIAHDIFDDALRRCGASWDASQSHGVIAARIAVEGQAALPGVAQVILEGTDPANALRRECEQLLGELFESTYDALASRQSGFSPLLPDDTDSADRRTEAIAHWSEGYLHGLVSAGHSEDVKGRLGAEPIADIIKDMLEITRAVVGEDESDESSEAAYAEIVEYLRVAAQLIFEELDETRVRDDA